MTIIGQLLVSLVVAAVASTALAYFRTGGLPDPALFLVFLAATVATALLTRLPVTASSAGGGSSAGSTPARRAPRQDRPVTARQAVVPEGPREQGQVKWFNVSKGFGFITKDDGEEIFVHFRSIRGEGRRSLKDGQRVSFVVAETDKGPQAEDVEPL
jgi:CspA family cold shock protein